MKKFLLAFAVSIVGVFVSQPAWGQAHAPLQYHGGTILRTFKIYPLYYGNWSSTDVAAQQQFLEGLTGYLSGKNNPADQQPMLWQYGVNSATVAPAATTNATTTNTSLTDTEVRNIIHTNQRNGKLSAYDKNTLIVLFLARGLSVKIDGGCAYHSSESSSAFYAVVPQACGPTMPLVTGHEVFEAAANPNISGVNGWDETVDGCSTVINLPFGQIPGVADNTQNGTCSTTGFTSTNEIQAYGWSYADYRKKYDELWPQGWRLYILQSYVSNGQVLYNAVWRPGNTSEIQVYGWSYADYRKKYDELWPLGWRLYILQPYLSNGQVLYNAVWRPGNTSEIQVYRWSYADYRKKYDELWPQGWRLYILDSYVSDGLVLYNAVWRLGLSNRPL